MLLLLPILAGPVIAGCGGSGARPPLILSGAGVRFEAPRGWSVRRSPTVVTVTAGHEFLQVARFPLVKRYTPALFEAVTRELRVRMRQVAGPGAKVEDAGEVTVSGIRSHVYRVSRAGHIDEYTFVLSGRREFQLLCREEKAGEAQCARLQASFRF